VRYDDKADFMGLLACQTLFSLTVGAPYRMTDITTDEGRPVAYYISYCQQGL